MRHHRTRRAATAAVVVAVGSLFGWLGTAEEASGVEVCGYVAAEVDGVTGTTVLIPNVPPGGAPCTSTPCGLVDVNPQVSQAGVSAGALVCLKP